MHTRRALTLTGVAAVAIAGSVALSGTADATYCTPWSPQYCTTTTPAPTTTAKPTTTVAPTTTVPVTTTAKPTTTVAPTIPPKPTEPPMVTTTAAPTTTAAKPPVTVAPATTVPTITVPATVPQEVILGPATSIVLPPQDVLVPAAPIEVTG